MARVKLHYDSSYIQCADLNLNEKQWRKFGTLIDSACKMGSPSSATSNPLINSNTIKAQCLTDKTKKKGDPTFNDPVMFDFLKKNNTYLTFGAGSPMTMSWTSAVTNAYQFSTQLQAAKSSGSSNAFDISASVFDFTLGGGVGVGGDSSVTINIGKTEDTARQFSRTLTVLLDDEDPGNHHDSLLTFLCIKSFYLFFFFFLCRRLFRCSNYPRYCLWYSDLYDYGWPIEVSCKFKF
jgi:hypothetical protein